MKYKMLAMIIALNVMSRAQTATQGTPANPPQRSAPASKGKCPCCDRMAAGEMKCAHHDMQAKGDKKMEAMPDGGEDMSCMRTKQEAKASCCGKDCENDKCGKASSKDQTAASCSGNRCDKDGKKCCAGKTSDKTAAKCCRHGLRGLVDR